MRLVLCDDQRIFGEALAVALEARGHQVLAITTAPGDGVAAVAAYQPDVCLLDLHFLGHGSGLDAARTIRQRQPDTRVLVLSAITEPAALAEARESLRLAPAPQLALSGGPEVPSPVGIAQWRHPVATPFPLERGVQGDGQPLPGRAAPPPRAPPPASITGSDPMAECAPSPR